MSCLLEALSGAPRLADVGCEPGTTAKLTYCKGGVSVVEIHRPVDIEPSDEADMEADMAYHRRKVSGALERDRVARAVALDLQARDAGQLA